MNNSPTRRNLRVLLIIFLAGILVFCAFSGGLVTARFIPGWVPSESDLTSTDQTPSEDQQSLFKPVWEAWDILHKDYLYQPLEDEKLVDGMIRGMLESLNEPYTGYWDKSETEDAQRALSGEYDGIGAWVDTEGEYLTIIEPMPGSPAEAAGLKKGDQIIAVNGEDVTGQNPNDVRLFKVLGPAGTQLTLTILRPGLEKPFDITLTRAHIMVPSTTSKILENNIGYLQIFQFGEKTADDVHRILKEFEQQGVTGIILDLRDNGGGLTDSATAVASEFIGQGVIWYEEFNDGQRVEHLAQSGGLALDIPLVVLVNEYSASASELLAGALQDYGRARLVGVTTYGKGVVQEWIPISNGGMVRVTISRFLTPKGHPIHKVGLTPDIQVNMTEEDYIASRDPQLEAAIQALINP